VRIHFAAKHAFELEASHFAFESLRIAIDVASSGLVILAFRELEEFCGVRNPFGRAVELDSVGGQPRPFASQLLGTLRLRPDGRVLQLASDLFEAFLLEVVLKETPVRSRCAPRDL
jgi:hypothetical protein